MKSQETPRTGRLGDKVAFPSRFGQCWRTLVCPKDTRSPAQVKLRYIFGSASQAYGLKLTEAQREHWIEAALSVPSHPSLAQYANLSGQQFCVKINATLQIVGQKPVAEPPQPVVFSPNPVGGLSIVYDDEGNLRLLLAIGAAVEDIMLFGQPPCNAGRMKHRRVYYLGLAGPAANGLCDITDQYVARFRQPSPGEKAFVVTNQYKNGWKSPDHVTSAIVPPKPSAGERQSNKEPKVLDCGAPVPLSPGDPQIPQESKVAPAAAPQPSQSPAANAQGSSSLPRAMYKGSTPEARGVHKCQPHEHPLSIPGTPLVHMVRLAIAWLGMMRTAGSNA